MADGPEERGAPPRSTTPTVGSRAVGLLQLARASLVPSAMADAVAGAALAGAFAGGPLDATALALAIVCSTALFLFGMALNDVADREKDAAHRPERPIPSGAVTPRAAFAFTLACGVVALAAASAGGGSTLARAAGVIVCVAAYNLLPRHGAALGPLLLGAIRAQNLLLGAAFLGGAASALATAAVYGLYIAAVSFGARMEDGEVPYSAAKLRGWVRGACAFALAAPWVASRVGAAAGHVAAFSGAAVAAFLVIRVERALRDATREAAPPPPAIPRLIGACLSGILLFDAGVTLARGAWFAGGALLVAFPLSRALVRRFPPS